MPTTLRPRPAPRCLLCPGHSGAVDGGPPNANASFCSMASLLSKFRIDYASLTMIQDISEPPKEETVAMFNKLLDGFREEDMKEGGETGEPRPQTRTCSTRPETSPGSLNANSRASLLQSVW